MLVYADEGTTFSNVFGLIPFPIPSLLISKYHPMGRGYSITDIRPIAVARCLYSIGEFGPFIRIRRNSKLSHDSSASCLMPHASNCAVSISPNTRRLAYDMDISLPHAISLPSLYCCTLYSWLCRKSSSPMKFICFRVS